jgi:hypothetical protein
MMRFILYALLIWFLYKLIFDFIIPVYKTTRQVKKKFSEMHDRMQEQQMNQQSFNQQPHQQKSPTKSPGGDYIDFEEVK